MRKDVFVSAVRAAMVAVCVVSTIEAQDRPSAPAITALPFRLVENFFHYPAYAVIGRLSGVAVGPNGTIVALNRGHHPVLEFKSDGSFVRSWGEGSRMFEGAHALRFDRDGDLWYIDAADNMIFHFDKEGRTVSTLGTNPEPWTWLTHVIERAAPGRANFYQETDIGWSRDGSMFVSDGYGNSRVAKFDKDGNFVKAWGERGTRPGDFNTPHSIAVGNNDVVYVADRGNSRIQTFDTDGNPKAVWNLPTAPWSLCMTATGANQALFVGSVGRVYKMDLTGKILGAFGRQGRVPGTLDSIHQLACPDEKTLFLANLYASRLDKWVAE